MSSSPDVQLIFTDNPGSLSASYALTSDIGLQSIVARIDGSGAAGNFLPCVNVLSQDGKLMARVPSDVIYAPGDTGVVTWSPFLKRSGSQAQGASLNIFAGVFVAGFVVGSGVVTPVNFTTEFSDTDNIWDPLFPSLFTARHSGNYLFNMWVHWQANVNGDRYVDGLHGGVILAADSRPATVIVGATEDQTLTSFNWNAPVNDQLQLRVYQDSGVNLQADVTASVVRWAS